jgi:tyrosine-protein phosphatase SIW14
MSRVLRVGAGTIVVVLLIVGPVAFALYEQAQMRNFRVVREGVLYRSGQMTPAGLKRLFHDHGIKTVICLRDGTTRLDQEEEALCGSEEVTFVRIPPSSWGDVGGTVPVEAGVKKFKEIMNDPHNYPVLVHCFAGIHRTGAYTAIYRMEFEHWSNEEAMAEMKACGYTTLEEELDILGFMEQYRPDWKPPEKPATPKPQARQPRKQMRRSGSHGPTVLTARYGGIKPACRKKRTAQVRPEGSRGRKTQSRPARRGATPPAGAAVRRRPGAA